jgi:aryl-alcohol dehydrogenase-like predicted oxidoreductase
VEETAEAFAELVHAGTIRAFGGSNVDAAWVEAARPAVVQNSFSLLENEVDPALRDLCARDGIAFTPFGPLAGGWLTGKYRRGAEPPAGSRMTLRPEPYRHLQSDRIYDALEAFERAASQRGTTPAALALAWLLADPGVTAIVLGPRRPEHLQPALDALELELTATERDELTALFA